MKIKQRFYELLCRSTPTKSVLARQGLKKFGFASHDKKIVPIVLIGSISFISTPQSMVEMINQSALFSYICQLNPFVLRMASYGNKPDYALYCHGMASILSPYFFYITFNSESLKHGIATRNKNGGKAALRNSAIAAAAVFILMFFYFGYFSPEYISRIDKAIFYSHTGIAFFSICFSFFLAVMLACFFLYTFEFLKMGIKP